MSELLKGLEMRVVEYLREQSRLLSVKEVSQMLSVSVRTVWRLVTTGELPKPCSIGRCSRWHREDVERFVAALRKSPAGVR
jgi:excisionase family DNA binding protein